MTVTTVDCNSNPKLNTPSCTFPFKTKMKRVKPQTDHLKWKLRSGSPLLNLLSITSRLFNLVQNKVPKYKHRNTRNHSILSLLGPMTNTCNRIPGLSKMKQQGR